MSQEQKDLRTNTLQARLKRAELQEEEAEMEHLQRALALQDQEEELAFNQQKRVEQLKRDEINTQCEMNWRRPSIFLHTEIFFDDEMNVWTCRYMGVFAEGDTPEMACANFDHLWLFGI